MSITQSGKKAHDDACNLSEMTRQGAVAAATGNQATVRTAEIVHYRACLASAPARSRTEISRAASFERCRIWARAAFEMMGFPRPAVKAVFDAAVTLAEGHGDHTG